MSVFRQGLCRVAPLCLALAVGAAIRAGAQDVPKTTPKQDAPPAVVGAETPKSETTPLSDPKALALIKDAVAKTLALESLTGSILQIATVGKESTRTEILIACQRPTLGRSRIVTATKVTEYTYDGVNLWVRQTGKASYREPTRLDKFRLTPSSPLGNIFFNAQPGLILQLENSLLRIGVRLDDPELKALGLGILRPICAIRPQETVEGVVCDVVDIGAPGGNTVLRVSIGPDKLIRRLRSQTVTDGVVTDIDERFVEMKANATIERSLFNPPPPDPVEPEKQ